MRAVADEDIIRDCAPRAQGKGVSVTHPRSPREGAASVTVPLEDLTLSERESIFHAPRSGDVALLGVLIAVLLGNGAWIWRQLGADSHVGRAVFFGLLLLCVYWCAIVYTFKLSLSVRISPRSVSVVRGPWHIEIRWNELTRLMERMQTLDGRRYRWVIALARDGRRISVREDAILDYAHFRREAYERYRLWRDHGGTWGATGSGPFLARETVRDEAQWWLIGAAMIALPGLYFTLLLPETNPLGYLLLALAVGCLVMMARVFLLRQSYTIERQYIEARSAVKRTRLSWTEVSKVERMRHPVGGVILSGVALGRLALRLASRGDAGIRSFAWSPRVPEYLILRGGGRQARIRLHRLMQPDELLAWIEFYDQVRRSASATRSRPTSAPLAGPTTGPVTGPRAGATRATAGMASGPLSAQSITPDMSGPSGPLDPWGAGRQGEPVTAQPTTLKTPFVARTPTSPRMPDMPDMPEMPVTPWSADEPDDRPAASQDDAWLRETGALLSVDGGGEPVAPIVSAPPDRWTRQRERPQPAYDEYADWHAEPAPMPAPQIPHPQMPAPPMPAPPMPAPQTPAPQTPATSAPPQPNAAWEPSERWDADLPGIDNTQYDDLYQDEEETPTGEVEAAPWREEGWQPPILPRFGPKRDEPPDQR